MQIIYLIFLLFLRIDVDSVDKTHIKEIKKNNINEAKKNPNKEIKKINDAQKRTKKCEMSIKVTNEIIDFESSSCVFEQHNENSHQIAKTIYYKYFFLKTPSRFVFDVYSKNINIKILTDKKSNIITRHSKKDFGYRFVTELDKKISITKNLKKIECKIAENKKTFNDYVSQYISEEEDNEIIKKIDQNKFTIAIDAGHGGKDPGCVGIKSKILEKDITLKYALELKDILLKNNFNVVMTRTSDKYVNLRKRVEIATKYNSDIFVSLHVDALKSKKPGSAIYIISDINLGHEDRDLFYIESYTPKNILKNYTNMIRNLLIDIYHKDTKQKAKILSQKILKRMKDCRECNGKCTPKERSFGVLRRVDMPSILIELGFINHQDDEARLLSPVYRKEILDNILHGIKDYINATTNR